MRTNVYTLALLTAFAAACSPSESTDNNGILPGPSTPVNPGGTGTVPGPVNPVNPTGTVQPNGTTQQPVVNPTSTDPVNPTPVNPTPTSTGGNTEPTQECPTGSDLAVVHTNGNWIGCDPESSTDNPGGVQGAFYLYGDGKSCDDTAVPCDAQGCHLKGTSIDGDPGKDWGCGLGLGLNTDVDEVKHPYTAAKCFDVVLEGSTGGLDLRIAFTQHDGTGATKVAPFRNIAAFDNGWSGEVCVTDVSCPSWSLEDNMCEETGSAYDLQIQVAAGEMDAEYNLTLKSLIPKTDSSVVVNDGMGPKVMTVSGSGCDNYHTARVGADGQEYVLINNVWHPQAAAQQQCIEYNGTSFTITSQGGTSNDDMPMSFPAVILGRKAEHVTTGGGLPIQVSAVQSIETGFKIKAAGISGTFNAAYDIWIDANKDYNGNGPNYFLMLWPWTQGNIQPAGSITANVTIEGVKWNVWTGGVGQGNGKYIAYQAANTESLHVDLKPFLDDAVASHGLPATSYVLNVQAGFEIWSGGVGLKSEYFYANVK